MYPVTPTLSVEAVQDKLVLVWVVPEAVKFVGVEGAVVSDVPAVIVKFVFDTSKKIWLVPLIMILFCVPGVFGIVTACVPSFGVAANNVDQVVPPLVEIKISTFAKIKSNICRVEKK